MKAPSDVTYKFIREMLSYRLCDQVTEIKWIDKANFPLELKTVYMSLLNITKSLFHVNNHWLCVHNRLFIAYEVSELQYNLFINV